jgi:hypothetical protein
VRHAPIYAALVAEPIKDYYKSKGDLKRLRLALYTELQNNYKFAEQTTEYLKNKSIGIFEIKALEHISDYLTE